MFAADACAQSGLAYEPRLQTPELSGEIGGGSVTPEGAGMTGGETGIRTLETVARLHAFQACAFDHSATSP